MDMDMFGGTFHMVNPLRYGQLGTPPGTPPPMSRGSSAAITIDANDPRVRRALLSPALRQALAQLQQRIDLLAAQPGATKEGVMQGAMGGEMGFAFLALLPMLAPLLGKMLSPAASAPASSSPPAGGDALTALIQSVLTQQHAPGQVSAAEPGKALTPDEVTALVRSQVAQQLAQRPPGAGMTAQAPHPSQYQPIPASSPCDPGDVYSKRYGICYNPAYFASEEAAHAAMTGQRQPTVPPHPTVGRGARKTAVARTGGRRVTRVTGKNINGIFLSDAAFPWLGASESAPTSGAAAFLFGLGGLLAATGATVAAIRASR